MTTANGTVRRRSSVRNLVVGVADLVACHRACTNPSECDGDPGGVDMAIDPPRFLAIGDRVWLSTAWGKIVNTMAPEPKSPVLIGEELLVPSPRRRRPRAGPHP